MRSPLACSDVLSRSGSVVARTSEGALLPVPVVQNCSGNVLWLALVLLCGCTLASLAWVAMLRAGVGERVALVLLGAAAATGITFPYVSTTDAYAYALYGYEAGVAHVSPYRPAHLDFAPEPQYAALVRLFPDTRSGVRLANYGPVFVALYSGVALASRGSLHAAILLERTLSAFALLAIALALRRTAVFVVAPLMILELVAFAHSDACMLAVLAIAWVCYGQRRITACSAAIVLAGEIKGIALLALVALAIDCIARERTRDAAVAGVSAAFTLAITAAVSYIVFGTFSLGAAPAISPLSSPAMMLAAAAGGSIGAIKVFAGIQLALGLFVALNAFLRRRGCLAAVAATASLPSVFPWYLCWLIPLGAIAEDPAFTAASIALACTGIADEPALMIANVPLWMGAVLIAVIWGVPAIVYWRARSANWDARAPAPQ